MQIDNNNCMQAITRYFTHPFSEPACSEKGFINLKNMEQKENYRHLDHENIDGEVTNCVYEKKSTSKGIWIRLTTRGKLNKGDTIGIRDTIYRLVEIIEENKSKGSWEDGIQTVGIFKIDVQIRNHMRIKNGIGEILLSTIGKIDLGFKMPAIGRRGFYELVEIKSQILVDEDYITEGIVNYLYE